MLIDHYLPHSEATQVQEVSVHASPTVTYGAIRETNLSDPLIDMLFTIRELPVRLARRLRGETRRRPEAVTFNAAGAADMGFMVLEEKPGEELVVGSVGRFWQRDYGWHPVAPSDFLGFREPGFAKLVLSFRVKGTSDGGSLLRYEARTTTTDDVARIRFRRYWRIIRPGVAIIMQRALARIRAEAERRQALVGIA